MKKAIQLVSVSLAIVALLWLLNRIGWTTIAQAVSRVGWQGAAVLCLLTFAESILDGAALRAILGRKLRLAFAVVVNAAGSTLNLILPWESGEVLKTGLLGGSQGAQEAISGTILWNYIFKISRPALSALTAVLAWALCRDLNNFTIVVVLLANLLAFLPYFLLRLLIRYGAAEGLFKLLRMIPGIRRHPAHWVDLARNIDREVQQFWRLRRGAYLRVFMLQVVARSTGWIGIYAGFRFLGMPYGFAQATLVYATMNVAEYVIAILPARVGVSEGTAFFAFKFLGLDPSLGVILYVVLRVRTVFANGVLTPLAFLNWDAHRAPSEPARKSDPAV
jgi:hypothetical protein